MKRSKTTVRSHHAGRSRSRFAALGAGVVAASLLLMACASGSTPGGTGGGGSLPKTSHDGLVLQEDTRLRAVYLKPGATLEPYSKVKLLDCAVAFEKNWQRDYNDRADFNARISDADMEKVKARVAADFRKIFTKVLEKQGHSVVDETGRDVLIVRPAIIDLTITAPDVMRPGMNETFVSSAGGMTLYMELYDSVTSSILARVIDPETSLDGARRANSVTNAAAEERILTRWAEILAKHLGQQLGQGSAGTKSG